MIVLEPSDGMVGYSAVTGSAVVQPVKEQAVPPILLGAAPFPVPSHPEGLPLARIRAEAFIALGLFFDRLEEICA